MGSCYHSCADKVILPCVILWGEVEGKYPQRYRIPV